MSALEFRFLGDFEVLRDGEPLPLPPSKKTRALLAYLSLHGRRFRREKLCELLWEVPDDPRGSLRWSLSKLRRLIDDEARTRIDADRSSVGVNTDDVRIDVAELRALAGRGLADMPLDELEAAAARFRGMFLEGLEFSRFHDFHSWCVAEREQSIRDRAALLGELVRRLKDDPQRAIPYARTLVGLSPYDEPNRASLIRLLNAAGSTAEAEEQYQLGLRMLGEAGLTSAGALLAARRKPDVNPPLTTEAATAIPRPPAPELVGREPEICALNDTLDQVAAGGQASVLLVCGVPGIGKSRMLDVLLELAVERSASVLQSKAFEADAIRPFALWIDALRTAGADAYEQVFGATDLANRERLFGALADFVAGRANAGPVVIVFDDLHWADESSAAALHYILRTNRNLPVYAVLAARGGELRDNRALDSVLRGMRRDGLLEERSLGPLPRQALQQLIADRAPSADCRRLSGECGGNPLLAIELARAESEGTEGGSIDDLVRERLARFSADGADVLRWASALMPPFDIRTLAEITGLESTVVGEAFSLAEAQAMLVSSGQSLRFSHELIGKAVYNDISPIRRQGMHRRVAELLERDFANDVTRAFWLAHHATLSGDPGLAARSMASAGRLCLRFFANDDARSLAKRGLRFAKALNDADRVAVEIELHDVLLSAEPIGDWERAAELYTSLAEHALDHGDVSHARLGYHMASYVRWERGEWKGAREQSLQSARVIRGEDSKAHIVGMAETAKCLVMLERDLSQAEAMLMECGSLAKRRHFVHPAIAAATGMLRLHENRLDEAEELFQDSWALCRSAGDRLNEFLALEYLAVIAFQRGDYATARKRAGQLVTLGSKIREGSEKPFADALLGLCDYVLEDRQSALDDALEGLRIADAKYRLAYILTRAALIDCERGNKRSAVARATEALAYARLLERPTEMLLANAVLACGYTGVDKDDAAKHHREVERLLPDAASWTGDVATALAQGH